MCNIYTCIILCAYASRNAMKLLFMYYIYSLEIVQAIIVLEVNRYSFRRWRNKKNKRTHLY